MTPERFLEIVKEHLEHDCSEAAHMVLSDRIYEESGGDELLAAGIRYHGKHAPQYTLQWFLTRELDHAYSMTRNQFGTFQLKEEIERTLTQKDKTGRVKIVK